MLTFLLVHRDCWILDFYFQNCWLNLTLFITRGALHVAGSRMSASLYKKHMLCWLFVSRDCYKHDFNFGTRSLKFNLLTLRSWCYRRVEPDVNLSVQETCYLLDYLPTWFLFLNPPTKFKLVEIEGCCRKVGRDVSLATRSVLCCIGLFVSEILAILEFCFRTLLLNFNLLTLRDTVDRWVPVPISVHKKHVLCWIILLAMIFGYFKIYFWI
jgi:hypothetical protein